MLKFHQNRTINNTPLHDGNKYAKKAPIFLSFLPQSGVTLQIDISLSCRVSGCFFFFVFSLKKAMRLTFWNKTKASPFVLLYTWLVSMRNHPTNLSLSIPIMWNFTKFIFLLKVLIFCIDNDFVTIFHKFSSIRSDRETSTKGSQIKVN